MKKNLQENPSPSQEPGTLSSPESDAHPPNPSGAVLVPAAPPISERIGDGSSPPLSVLSVTSDRGDRAQELEALRQQIQTQHSNNQKLLQSILEVEQASGWANHPAALNSVCQILSETKEFHSWLLQLQLKMTFATMHKK